MAVFKRYQGKKIDSRHPKYAKARWWCYKRVKGKTIHCSLPEATTKTQAEHAERVLVDRLFNRRYGVTDTETTFGRFADEKYKPYYEARNTNINAKRLDVDLLKKHWQHTPLAEITPQDCRNVQAALRRRKVRNSDKANVPVVSPSSVNRTMTTASRIFTLACQEGILNRNPMQFVEKLKEPPPRSRLLTNEEKERLWEHLITADTLLSRLVTLAVNLPLRRAQLLALTPDAIDLQNGLLLCTASKGRNSRVIPINSIALTTLRDMITDGQLPFPLKDFRKRWSKALIAAGINEKDGKRGDNFTFHDLRKEFASELIRRNVNPNVVQKLFAHSDMAITNVYMHSEMDDLKAAVSALDENVLDSEVIQ